MLTTHISADMAATFSLLIALAASVPAAQAHGYVEKPTPRHVCFGNWRDDAWKTAKGNGNGAGPAPIALLDFSVKSQNSNITIPIFYI